MILQYVFYDIQIAVYKNSVIIYDHVSVFVSFLSDIMFKT